MPEKFCTHCGQRLDHPTRFCESCGHPIEPQEPAAADKSTEFRNVETVPAAPAPGVGRTILTTLHSSRSEVSPKQAIASGGSSEPTSDRGFGNDVREMRSQALSDPRCPECGQIPALPALYCCMCGAPLPSQEADRFSSRLPARRAAAGFPSSGPLTSSSKTELSPTMHAPGAKQGFMEAEGKTGEANVRLQKMQEPNERAFKVLVPEGWQISGGIFRINPNQVNGPGNTITPKCDFTVKSDKLGTIMIRWMPSWNFADLTFASAAGFFAPGQWYQGMPVRYMVSPKQFLLEMLSGERPQGSDHKILWEDPMMEITAEFEKQAAQVNRSLQQMGLHPSRFASCALLVEYAEGGERYLERIITTIADNRPGAFMWTNENTVMLRAPAAVFHSWLPVLDKIYAAREVDPEWLAAVEKTSGERAKKALQIQQRINATAAAAMANRRRTVDYLNQGAKDIWNGRRSVTDDLQRQADDYWATPSGEDLDGFDDPPRYSQ